MNRHRLVLPLALLVGGLSACAQAQPSTSPPTLVTTTPTGWITPIPPGSTTPSATSCQYGTVMLQIRSGPPPAPSCLRTGATLRLTADPSPAQPWQPLVSSNPTVLRCQSQPAAEGSIAGSCLAVSTGNATLRTSTAPFAGDPHGPPQYEWELAVTITP